jgi:hypothetical protein
MAIWARTRGQQPVISGMEHDAVSFRATRVASGRTTEDGGFPMGAGTHAPLRVAISNQRGKVG